MNPGSCEPEASWTKSVSSGQATYYCANIKLSACIIRECHANVFAKCQGSLVILFSLENLFFLFEYWWRGWCAWAARVGGLQVCCTTVLLALFRRTLSQTRLSDIPTLCAVKMRALFCCQESNPAVEVLQLCSEHDTVFEPNLFAVQSSFAWRRTD